MKHGNHFLSDLNCHLIFVTKYRRKVITPRVKEKLVNIFQEICETMKASILECNGEEDHIHLLIEYHPATSISNLVQRFKGISSRTIRSLNYPEVSRKLWGCNLWSNGYFVASCGGVTVEMLKKYVENQGSEGN